jgi:hypothetical protein
MFGRVEPGFLIAYEGGRVSFVTPDGTVFDADRAELGVTWPWWELGAGVHLTLSGKVYRLSLTRPPNASDADPTGVTELVSIRGALSNGKAWRTYLRPPA